MCARAEVGQGHGVYPSTDGKANSAFLAAPSAWESRTAYCLHSIDELGGRDWLGSAMEHLWYGDHVTITRDGTCLGISGLSETEPAEMFCCCGEVQFPVTIYLGNYLGAQYL